MERLARELVLTRDAGTTGGAPRTLVRAHAAGELVRVRRGAYVGTTVWEAATAEERHALRACAATALFPGVVLSHQSAAVAWGVPRTDGWDEVAHVCAGAASGGRSTSQLVQHTFGGELEVVARGSAGRCVGAERTVVDLALTDSFASALASADWALRVGLAGHDGLARVLSGHAAVLGRARAERVLAHADGRSGSVGESVSRARMLELGLPRPQLQVEVRDADGLAGRVDFAWEDLALVGEFDGRAKYLREEYLGGWDPGEVVWAEKRREDRLRGAGWRVVRWGWDDLADRTRLARLLAAAGLRGARAVPTEASGRREVRRGPAGRRRGGVA
ncbi:type IV toxin-antitoxin system AbiEi family antitoxin domain-containing protein [Luteimicrobium subarcticum]|uniref:type IV toxin-antitoxin system AbiEi family antitoxin domain-containing protein n=1 Tax=Luteimicrobium subarcticum TaxID=620910 RepID=UPI001473529B|nr:type IV toxin-antitoxin system AbiEi family antitoxin domain-containing protein [Luteimicrobium subarcticum]